jgi:hypothetical protein
LALFFNTVVSPVIRNHARENILRRVYFAFVLRYFTFSGVRSASTQPQGQPRRAGEPARSIQAKDPACATGRGSFSPLPVAAGHKIACNQIDKECADHPRERDAHNVNMVHLTPERAAFFEESRTDRIVCAGDSLGGRGSAEEPRTQCMSCCGVLRWGERRRSMMSAGSGVRSTPQEAASRGGVSLPWRVSVRRTMSGK